MRRNASREANQRAISGRRQMLYALISLVGQKIIVLAEFFVRPLSGIYEIDSAWALELARHTNEILREFRNLTKADLREFCSISPEQKRITTGGSWQVYILFAYRRKIHSHMESCPLTSRLLSGNKQVTSAMFSMLKAGSRIARHRGPYLGVIRCHIPLLVPTGDCGICVAGEVFRWQHGIPLVFDDTLEHEAWNSTKEDRVVLFLDFVRPFPFPLNILNRLLIRLIGISPFIGRMVRKGF